jgi:mannose-6-phosphate isomerase-like protein (cupin superfamily)
MSHHDMGVHQLGPGAVVIRPETAPRRSLRAGRGEVLSIVGPPQGSGLDVHVNAIRAGAGPGPYHMHSAAQNFYLVLEGSVRLRIAGEEAVAGPGDAILIAPGVPHSVSVVDDGPARLLEIYAPAAPDFVPVKEEGDPA